jgi:hypothetical protein
MENDVAVQFDFITRRIDRRIECGMYDGDVITFEIILDVGFPVAANFMRYPLRRAKAFERHVTGALCQGFDDGRNRLRRRVHVDENKSPPGFAGERHQRIFARIESFRGAEIARAGEPPVERITPTVITADEVAFATALAVRRERTGAMAADVVERAYPVVAAHGDDGITGNRQRNPLPRLGKLRFVADELPASRKDAAAFVLVHGRITITLGSQGFCGKLRHEGKA